MRTGFVKDILHRYAGTAVFFESEGGGEAGDAAANDGDAFHG
jgi:hypothetical protein